MKYTKAQRAVRLFHYWCGRLKLPKPIEAIRDNRMDCPLMVIVEKDFMQLRYHTRRLGKKPICVVISDIFHEIGHILYPLPYRTEKQKIKCEEKAERFAIRMIKKYYPKMYKQLVERFKQNKVLEKLKKEEPLYYNAFKNIKEYQYE